MHTLLLGFGQLLSAVTAGFGAQSPDMVVRRVCSKPVKRGELLARIKAHLRVKSDATWVQSIVKGVLTEDSEAMKILESILPESIISRIQVSPHVRHSSAI